ncbi:MAG: hypothetical protein HETSPECPRED_005255 [Heterodermia speciosa]|uniref:Peptidase S8/S53 domain-containing protein n=1 Tax=Heterodermia speciosa TaxID=116794 RepID=A0A8H3FBX6_9LECA|nr:MAG: hypothetical protein HETSPECPRED_005255 [Heterodermia speciosa]
MSNTGLPVDAEIIEVNGQVIDPSEHYAQDAKNTNHIIVTVKDVLNDDQKAELSKLQVELLEDLGNHNLLCRYRRPNLQPIRGLDFIKQVDVYRNLFKIPDVLLDLIQELKGTPESATAAFPIDVMVHQGVEDLEALADQISKTAEVDRSRMELMPGKIRLEASLGKLRTIAGDDRIRVIEEVVTPVLFDDQAKRIVLASSPDPKISEFRGKGQTIAVFDSGFDLGSVDECHPALIGQVQKLIPVGRAKDQSKTEVQKVDDPKGHGTHVCGVIVGKEIDTSQGSVGGVAQDARVVLSSLEDSNEDVMAVDSIGELFKEPYVKYDARIHSNSWGDGLGIGKRQRPYGTAAAGIDDFVRTNPDALVCFSAGNNNLSMIQQGTQNRCVGSQAAAKNCLTVGASGSTRIIFDSKNGKSDRLDPDQIYPGGSRGPTAENRVKPDVVALGYNIFSAHSRHPRSANNSAAEATSEAYPKTLWKVRTGTSQATPLVSGCAAILRQILQSKGSQSPPAALLKALIVNGADQLPNIDIAAQGFGRVNMQSSIAMIQSSPIIASEISASPLPSLGSTLIRSPLKQGEKLEFTLAPEKLSDDAELKITMVYNDLPGRAIQNNLNLAVLDGATGVTRQGGISEDKIDLQNNIEQVVWFPAPKSPVIVRVTAQKIFDKSEQDFALAWSISAPYKGGNIGVV